jgi:hypothetical protein
VPDDLSWLPQAILEDDEPDRWDAGLGGNPTREWVCPATYYYVSGKRTLRCRLFGCKPIDDATIKHLEPLRCDCGPGLVYQINDGTDWGRCVHIGCCVRCCLPIIPRATARRRLT